MCFFLPHLFRKNACFQSPRLLYKSFPKPTQESCLFFVFFFGVFWGLRIGVLDGFVVVISDIFPGVNSVNTFFFANHASVPIRAGKPVWKWPSLASSRHLQRSVTWMLESVGPGWWCPGGGFCSLLLCRGVNSEGF